MPDQTRVAAFAILARAALERGVGAEQLRRIVTMKERELAPVVPAAELEPLDAEDEAALFVDYPAQGWQALELMEGGLTC